MATTAAAALPETGSQSKPQKKPVSFSNLLCKYMAIIERTRGQAKTNRPISAVGAGLNMFEYVPYLNSLCDHWTVANPPLFDRVTTLGQVATHILFWIQFPFEKLIQSFLWMDSLLRLSRYDIPNCDYSTTERKLTETG